MLDLDYENRINKIPLFDNKRAWYVTELSKNIKSDKKYIINDVIRLINRVIIVK